MLRADANVSNMNMLLKNFLPTYMYVYNTVYLFYIEGESQEDNIIHSVLPIRNQ